MYNISIELLSEVLDINDVVHVQKEGNNSIFISRANNPAYIINIYELAFKCKEWALLNNYILNSQIRGYCVGKGICFVYEDDWTSEFNECCLKSLTSNTEVESIVKACQWILEQRSKTC